VLANFVFNMAIPFTYHLKVYNSFYIVATIAQLPTDRGAEGGASGRGKAGAKVAGLAEAAAIKEIDAPAKTQQTNRKQSIQSRNGNTLQVCTSTVLNAQRCSRVQAGAEAPVPTASAAAAISEAVRASSRATRFPVSGAVSFLAVGTLFCFLSPAELSAIFGKLFGP
jgi:hypothetical protein